MVNNKLTNPFEYEAAVNFGADDLIELFVEDHNYSRFIQSSRNIFIVGERGSGKSMTLLYNSYPKQKRIFEKNNIYFDCSTLGIYVPCTNPLFFKKEYELISNEFKASVLSEHFFVLAIAYELASILSTIENLCSSQEEEDLRLELNYILNIELRTSISIFKALAQYFQKLNSTTQQQVNNREDSFCDNCVSFYSLIVPLLRTLKSIQKISLTHFLFLIDDAHDLNLHQIQSLNSWIAYRDHTDFSFKVAIAKVKKHSYLTSTGSSIIEGHDFLSIDMEKPFQSKFSDFGQWAKEIIEKRLEKFNIDTIEVNKFFPVNVEVERGMKHWEDIVREKAETKYKEQENSSKKISDYVYKYARAEYFRNRHSKANLPQYSGWETIVHLSTGIIRNLLYPCYWMYDKEISKLSNENNSKQSVSRIKFIRPSIQDEVIKEKSKELWNRIENDLFNNIDNCSTKQALEISNLFDQLSLLFYRRLMSTDSSEPRAITFSISAREELADEANVELDELLRISKEALILYDRKSSAKEFGEKETIFVPNRLLFPFRGLDVIGQHSRVSIKAKEIYTAAKFNKKINIKEISQQTQLDYEY